MMNFEDFEFPNLFDGINGGASMIDRYPQHSGSTIMRSPGFRTATLPNGAEVVVGADGELPE